VSDTSIGQGADLISIGEVAALLSVSKSAATRIIVANVKDFPRPFRLKARTVKYSKAAVLAWLQSKQDK
jgi:predicted DNA-binding transcriptional regulator AlpA